METQSLAAVRDPEPVNQHTECPCRRAIYWMLSTKTTRHQMANRFFAERLKVLIGERFSTQAEFAKYIKVDPSMVSHYVRGASNPESDFLLDIADLFDVSIDWLMGRTDDRSSHKKKLSENQ